MTLNGGYLSAIFFIIFTPLEKATPFMVEFTLLNNFSTHNWLDNLRKYFSVSIGGDLYPNL